MSFILGEILSKNIKYNQNNFDYIQNNNEDINDNDYEHLAQDFAKYRHNRWVDHKVATGWRYGQEINEEEKTHPHLVNWNALPESVRTVDGNIPSMFVSLLGHKGYGIHQK